jgi:hypothetical protein
MLATGEQGACWRPEGFIGRPFPWPEGETHFGEIDVPPLGLNDAEYLSAKQFAIFRLRGSDRWHNAPRRQIGILLTGECEMVTSDGETRRFTAGDVALSEDLTGKGHITRVVGSEECWCAVVRLDD